MTAPKPHLGLGSGVGLVAGSMIGSGVLLSAGFMAETLSAGWILLAWVIGATIAGLGAVAYAELARLEPRSGGEYRYLSRLLHPLCGYLAGWASLLLGFAAPIAINALGAAAYAGTIAPIGDQRIIAAGLIAAITAAHAFDLSASRWIQDILAAAKLLAVGGFVAVGLILGSRSWPSWTPPASDGFSTGGFVVGLFFVSYAFSGWSSAVYASSEFKRPGRDVPRSMLVGTAVVGVLYLLINWVFVANLDPERAAVVRDPDSYVTLAHVVAGDLLGPAGATAMSAMAVLAFVSAMSAIAVLGPRVYAEMAGDRMLPRFLAYRGDRPPVGSVLLQGALAIVILLAQELREVLINASAILLLFSALSAAALLRVALSTSMRERYGAVRPIAAFAAAAYAGLALAMLIVGFRDQPSMLGWIALVAAIGAAGYFATRR
jgi:APA family basic amino acid/polyamine antiporter